MSHLALVPDPAPEERAAYLRLLILNATDLCGADSPYVAELKAKFDDAMRAVVRSKRGRQANS